jgi:Trp operon repressor
MKRYYSDVREALREVFQNDWDGSRGIKSRGADRLTATVGYEGTGKSNFALICMEEWYKVRGIESSLELVKQITATPEEFAISLIQSQPYDMLMVDEGVLMSYARKGMSESNVQVNKMLMVCRGKHFYFNILIPNFLDLDSYIRKNRVSSIWVMMPNYMVAYFSRKRVHKLIGRMAYTSRGGNHADPLKLGIKPNFVARVPLYEGILAEPYAKIKANNMAQVIKGLSDELLKKQKEKSLKPKIIDGRDRLIIQRLNQNVSCRKIAEELGVSIAAVVPRIQKLKRMGIDPYQHHTEAELNKWMFKSDGQSA